MTPSFTIAAPVAPSLAPTMKKPSFTVKASELLSALKAAEAFRKGVSAASFYRKGSLDSGAIFLSANGPEGFYVEGFLGQEAFCLWLPSGKLSGSFSLPVDSLLPFVKATKGKGELSYGEGKLSAFPSGASLSLPAGESLKDSDSGERQELYASVYSLPTLSASIVPDDQPGFPLAPFLTASCFASDDAGKHALSGIGFSDGAFCGTDGFSLRQTPAFPSLLPKAAGGFPENAWLPAWLSPCAKALCKASEEQSLLAFHWPMKQSLQAVRFWLPSGILAAFRFSEKGSFPQYRKLIPDSLPFAFACNRKPFLSAVEALLSTLKASDGAPHIELSFQPGGFSSDGPGEVVLSVTLQKNKGTKAKPELSDVGSQEASFCCSFTACSADPAFQEGFFDLPESQREMAKAKHQHESRILCNAFFLQRALKSFAGDRLLFQWKSELSPFLLSCFAPDDLCLIMPVQKRR
jgi:hypothetical protein